VVDRIKTNRGHFLAQGIKSLVENINRFIEALVELATKAAVAVSKVGDALTKRLRVECMAAK
jgi:hypothetical protein